MKLFLRKSSKLFIIKIVHFFDKFGILIFRPFFLKNKIIVTCGNGVYVIDERSYKTTQVTYCKSYGIFNLNNQLYFFAHKHGNDIGYVYKIFSIFDLVILSIKTNIRLSNGCHQITTHNNKFYIADTYNNRVLIYDHKFNFIQLIYCLKKINSRKDIYYSHINSIYVDNDNIYMLFHNETLKTGKKSQLCKYNKKNKKIKIINTSFGCAHNILKYKNKFLICDSLNSKIYHGNRIFLNTYGFTRGLLIHNKKLFIGDSLKKHISNNLIKSTLLVYDLKNMKNLKKISFNTQIYEIFKYKK